MEPLSDLSCCAGTIVDGINAVPPARDSTGRRRANVEADLFLLVERQRKYSILVVEVKESSNNAWYAAVENLLQLRLTLESPEPRLVFYRRARARNGLCEIPDVPLVPQGVVLAPK